ncbi:MAG: type II secretion system F family protein [Eubacteriales bacterium]|nr:type II secretion system F family protein [Eubacteriales bacterium]
MKLYFLLVALQGLLFFLSAGIIPAEKEEIPIWQKPFYQEAGFLLGLRERAAGEKADRRKRAGRKSGGRETEESEARLRKRLAYVMMALFLGLGFTLLLEFAGGSGQTLLEALTLQRPEHGESAVTQQLQVQFDEFEEVADIEVDLEARRFTEEEKEKLLDTAVEELDRQLPGEGQSADHVQGQVVLPAEMLDGAVELIWFQDPQNLLDEEGYISEDLSEEGELLTLKAVLSCQNAERIYERVLRLYPVERSSWEALVYQLRRAIRSEEEKSASDGELTLPEEIDGIGLTWMRPAHSLIGLGIGLTLFAAAAVWLGMEQVYEERVKARRRQLQMDYPDLLFKLGMLLSAGMTMQEAFTKAAREYENRKRKSQEEKKDQREKVRYAYEEMLTACREMQTGVSEAKAYENYGQRCQLPGYIKLGTLLSGGLQKGSEGLSKLLLDEAELSLEERQQFARQLGEEAGTKLLLPMTGMLMVVLAVLMVPAMMSL